MLVRLIGVLCITMAALEVGLYWAKCSIPGHRAPVHLLPVLLRSIPAAAGLVVLIRARAIAGWISNVLDL